MQPSNANQYRCTHNPVWQFLAEHPLSEFLSDHDNQGEPTAGRLFQTMRELGIPLEYIKNIEMTLTEFAKEALVHFKQGSIELPGCIRIFCQKMVIDDVNSAKSSSPELTDQTMEYAPTIDRPGTIINGGWGYFIIERSMESAGSSDGSHSFFDLYLYKEGE